MNLRRGLFRVWITGSLLWMGGWLIFVWLSCDRRNIPEPLGGGHAIFCRTSLLDDWMTQTRYFDFTDYGHIVGTALGPPVAFLAAAYALGWIIRGFAR